MPRTKGAKDKKKRKSKLKAAILGIGGAAALGSLGYLTYRSKKGVITPRPTPKTVTPVQVTPTRKYNYWGDIPPRPTPKPAPTTSAPAASQSVTDVAPTTAIAPKSAAKTITPAKNKPSTKRINAKNAVKRRKPTKGRKWRFVDRKKPKPAPTKADTPKPTTPKPSERKSKLKEKAKQSATVRKPTKKPKKRLVRRAAKVARTVKTAGDSVKLTRRQLMQAGGAGAIARGRSKIQQEIIENNPLAKATRGILKTKQAITEARKINTLLTNNGGKVMTRRGLLKGAIKGAKQYAIARPNRTIVPATKKLSNALRYLADPKSAAMKIGSPENTIRVGKLMRIIGDATGLFSSRKEVTMFCSSRTRGSYLALTDLKVR